MYRRQAKRCGWKFDLISVSDFDTGGYREATASLKGPEVRSKTVRARLGLGLGLGASLKGPEVRSKRRHLVRVRARLGLGLTPTLILTLTLTLTLTLQVFSKMRHESGVHRVQRIPKTGLVRVRVRDRVRVQRIPKTGLVRVRVRDRVRVQRIPKTGHAHGLAFEPCPEPAAHPSPSPSP